MGKITFADDGGYYAVSDIELVKYGDANKDGAVSVKDVLRVLKQSVSDVADTDLAACDMDGTLKVDINDVLMVIRDILG